MKRREKYANTESCSLNTKQRYRCDRSRRSVTRSYLASFSSTAISACRSSSPGGKTLNGLCRLSQQNSLSEGGIAFLVEPLQLRVQVL